jgi:hypothetical protein
MQSFRRFDLEYAMFLVKVRRLGRDDYVFTHTDPRTEGFKGDVTEGVTLKYEWKEIVEWPEGQPRPNPQLGRDPNEPKLYRVFKYPAELHAAGFELVYPNTPFVEYSWSEYLKRYYPVPEEYARSMTQDEWFDFLEGTDSATKIRKMTSEPDKPTDGSNLQHVAEWVAKRHMGADGGINQVWFLHSGSPADEIRLLEISERFTGETTRIEPIDFGLDVDGKKYRLRVADVSMDRLNKIKDDPARTLPKDWKIEEAQIWDRRGRRQ